MFTLNVQLGYVLTRGEGLSANFITPSTSEILSGKRYNLFFQSFLDANFKHSVGLSIDNVWGSSCPGQFIFPSPRISERMDNTQILLHHLLQEYLVERDINFISINLSCSLQIFSWVTYWHGVGDKLSTAVYLVPRPESEREWIIRKFYYTMYNRNIYFKGI